MTEPKKDPKDLTRAEVHRITQIPIRRQETLEFAGYLTREDDDSVYIADPQGTWMIRREDIVSLGNWEPKQASSFMEEGGRPVRVSVKDGATIHEIRPWRVKKHAGQMGAQLKQGLQRVFSLGGSPLPIGERTALGEHQLAELERAYARRVGWSPDYVPGADLDTGMRSASHSQTIVMVDGY